MKARQLFQKIADRLSGARVPQTDPPQDTPELSRVGISTSDLLAAYTPYDATFTTHRREELKKNPYIYATLRNTREELVSKWYGAGAYVSRSENDENMERQPQILAATFLPSHEFQANHLRWNIDFRLKRSWAQVLRQLDCAREDGKAVLEIMWAYQTSGPYKGTWVIDDLIHCDPDCFHFHYTQEVNSDTGEIVYVRKMHFDPNRGLIGQPVPPGKFICFSFDEERERADGRSLLERLAVYDWYQRNNFVFWMVHLNRYGSPALLGKYPKGSGRAVVQKLIATVRSLQQETGIVIPEDQQIEILQAQQRDGGGFEKLNDIIVRIISEVIAGNAMALEMQLIGSYAATRNTTASIRNILLYARASLLDACINKQLIPWFMYFNYPDAHVFPRQQILPPRAEDIYNPASESQDVVVNQEESQAFAQKKKTLHILKAQKDDELEILYDHALTQGVKLFDRVWIQPTLKKIRAAETPQALQSLFLQPGELDPVEYADFLHRLLLSAYGLGLSQASHQMEVSQRFAEAEEQQLVLIPDPERIKQILLKKPLIPKREFERLSDNMKRRAFTIAGQESAELQSAVRQAIVKAVDQKLSLKEIASLARQTFREYGIAEQSNYHAATVFRTNLASAYADAQWYVIQDQKEDIAFLEYVSEEDPRVRPTHRKMHGVKRAPDDPVWQRWYPPNGYNCRCKIRIITKDEAQRRNIQPTPTLPNVQPDDGFASGPSMPGIEIL